MNKMTFRALRNLLNELKDDQLDCNCAVYVPWEDEYLELEPELWFADEDNGILDKDHPILYIINEG